MPKPIQRIVLQVSLDEYTLIQQAAQIRSTSISQLLREGLQRIGALPIGGK